MSNAKKNMIEDISTLSGVQKAAILLISVGVENASSILQELNDSEVEKITLEIANMDNISPSVVEMVMKEYQELAEARQFIIEGGLEYARSILTKTKGKHQAESILRRLENVTGNDAFGIFQASDTSNIVQFLQNEPPQIAAVILAHLKLDRAADILSNLPEEFQIDVAYRLATMNKISKDVIEEIEEVIREQMSGMYTDRENVNRGSSAVADILNEASIATERLVLDNISTIDPELAEEIKNQMFLFEDIAELDDRTVQLIVGEVDKNDLVLGLKGVDEKLLEKVLGNMSTRARDMMKDDMDALGPVHKKQVEEAQQRIIKEIKRLEEDGQISTRKLSSDEVIE